MDNITHSLLGSALAKTRLGRAGPWAPAALVLAANFPDLENLALAFYDKPTNMIHHRSVTHAVVGLAVQIPALTLLAYGAGRLVRRVRPTAAAPSFKWLLPGIALAMASHPLLDWLNTYGVRPWLPWNETWVYGDLAFIVDPWVWLLLGGVTALAGRRTRAGSLTLGLIALLLTAVVFLAPQSTRALLLAWPAAVTLIALARAWPAVEPAAGPARLAAAVLTLRRRPDRAVMVAMLLLGAYLALLYTTGRTAGRLSRAVVTAQLAPGERITARTLSPVPADPFRWEVITETTEAVYRHEFSIFAPPSGPVRRAKRLDDPYVQLAADSRAGRAWRVFARHPVAAVARNGHGRRVYLLDARYGLFPPRDFSSFVLDMPEQPATAALPPTRRRV